jgi:hypothetical protein|nr:hypothetical protein [uncultured Flavobacterium sp.]
MKLIKNTTIFFLLLVFIAICIIPIASFYLKFRDQEISSNISDWSSFGSYASGTLGIIISFFSLFILTYLTYLVSVQSSAENKKTNILLRKFDAYDKMTSYMTGINQFFPEMRKLTTLLFKKLKEQKGFDSIKEEVSLINHNARFFSEFYYTLFTFNVRFGHLFDYDFNSTDYKSLIVKAEKVNRYFQDVSEKLNMQEVGMPEIDNEVFKQLFDELAKILNELREELK